LVRDRRRKDVRAKAEAMAEDRVLDALVGTAASQGTREAFRKKLRGGLLADKEIELDFDVSSPAASMMEFPGAPGGMIDLGSMLQSLSGTKKRTRKTTVAEAYEPLVMEESDKLLDKDSITQEALLLAETEGVVFIDEVDKICARAERQGADVSREGVQRDLLPLIEGTTVSTKHGALKTDFILFIASGAFHLAKPSDLIPELQGRFPIRVELESLSIADFERILTSTDACLTRQYQALLATENVHIEFAEDGIRRLAEIAFSVNEKTENIGARRLYTVMEKLLEEVSFGAGDEASSTVNINAAYVDEKLGALAINEDLSRYVL
jgi:ATP-dependent HslUV protease ATP-binding subunit HslU